MSVSFSAPVVSEPSTQVVSPSAIPMLNGVPMSMVDYFNLDYRNLTAMDKKQINEIYTHFAQDGRPIEEITALIRGIESKHGVGSSDSRHSRVHRWVKISNQINELMAQRQFV